MVLSRYSNSNHYCMIIMKNKETDPNDHQNYLTGPQHILQDLNSALKLSIGLRVKCCAKINLVTELLLKIPPKF